MPAFRKFDPGAYLASLTAGPLPAKAANVAIVADGSDHFRFALAGLAALAEPDAELSSCTWRSEHDERAAIVEYEGGAGRVWAEGLARLCIDRPPSGVPPTRWFQFIDDCARFLDQGWGAKAEALGWGPIDLFGCDRLKPFARIDHAGLCWLLNGARVVAITDRHVVIEKAGARQVYTRRMNKGDCVTLPWQLVT